MKKYILTLGTVATAVVPLAGVISCVERTKLNGSKDASTSKFGNDKVQLEKSDIFDREISIAIKISDDYKINGIDIKNDMVSDKLSAATRLIRRSVWAIFDPIGYDEIVSENSKEIKHTTQAKKLTLNFTIPDKEEPIVAEVINTGDRYSDVKSFSVSLKSAFDKIDHFIKGFKKAFNEALNEDGFSSWSEAFWEFEKLAQ